MATTITDGFSERYSDHQMLVRSKYFDTPGNYTYGIIRVPRNGMVKDVWLNVVTAFTSATLPVVTVGFVGNGESENLSYFMTNEIADPKNAGIKRAQHDTLTSFEGKWFNAGSGAIVITFSGTATAGKCCVIADIIILS